MSLHQTHLNTIKQIPEFSRLLNNVDHIDIKTIEGETTLREFISGFINYLPVWIRLLYTIRMIFVRLLGMRQEGIPTNPNLKPQNISFKPGDKLAFFTVDSAEEDRFFIAVASEAHLSAYLGIVVEPLHEKRNRFYVVTIVHYHKWTGPVYFNVIRPFHHLVVQQMAQAGVR